MSACFFTSSTRMPQFPLWRSKLASSASPMNCLQKNDLSLSGMMRRCSSIAVRIDWRSVLYPLRSLSRQVFLRWANSISVFPMSAAKSRHATTRLSVPLWSLYVPRRVCWASMPMDWKTWHAMYSVRHEFA